MIFQIVMLIIHDDDHNDNDNKDSDDNLHNDDNRDIVYQADVGAYPTFDETAGEYALESEAANHFDTYNHIVLLKFSLY